MCVCIKGSFNNGDHSSSVKSTCVLFTNSTEIWWPSIKQQVHPEQDGFMDTWWQSALRSCDFTIFDWNFSYRSSILSRDNHSKETAAVMCSMQVKPSLTKQVRLKLDLYFCIKEPQQRRVWAPRLRHRQWPCSVQLMHHRRKSSLKYCFLWKFTMSVNSFIYSLNYLKMLFTANISVNELSRWICYKACIHEAIHVPLY